jgi:PAS domain-containing protein
MSMHAHLADRLRRGSASHASRAVGAWMARLLTPPTPQEDERRRAYLIALLLVAVVATAKHVTGLTDGTASYTVYMLAIAASALLGGFAPACVAMMASLLLASAYAHSPIGSADRMMFALEGLGVAALVAAVSSRVHGAEAELSILQAANDGLRGQARRGDITNYALQHLEAMAPDAAVFLVNTQGLIVEWSQSAERMYGHTAEQIVGSGLAAIFADEVATNDIQALLAAKPHAELARRPGVHRRSDGTRVRSAKRRSARKPPWRRPPTMHEASSPCWNR